MTLYLTIVLRLILAGVLGGVIGYEREHTNRPAGFRTHILVCVGAALVMVTSEFIFRQYAGQVNMDPARLGAQVISGIGFLGAGTIIRDGFNVRGLTTAASLWAVSAVGIAAGIGFYGGAIAATAIIFITLIGLKKFEGYFAKKNRYKVIFVHADNVPGRLGSISGILDKYSVKIRNIEFLTNDNDNNVIIKFLVKVPGKFDYKNIMSELQCISGIQKVYEE